MIDRALSEKVEAAAIELGHARNLAALTGMRNVAGLTFEERCQADADYAKALARLALAESALKEAATLHEAAQALRESGK